MAGRVIGPVDALHEGLGIVVELDGKRFHGPERFQRDRTRDQRLVAMGHVVLRFTWADLEDRPDEVRAIIRRTMCPADAPGRVKWPSSPSASSGYREHRGLGDPDRIDEWAARKWTDRGGGRWGGAGHGAAGGGARGARSGAVRA